MTLDQARSAIGKRVTYRPSSGHTQNGVITSVNNHYVFVRYNLLSEHAQATSPADLELVAS